MEAVALAETGVASPEDIDTACRLGFGHAMGPLATIDLTGIDILRNASMNIYEDTADEKFFPPALLARMVAAGELGRKSGQGFYSYDELTDARPGRSRSVSDRSQIWFRRSLVRRVGNRSAPRCVFMGATPLRSGVRRAGQAWRRRCAQFPNRGAR